MGKWILIFVLGAIVSCNSNPYEGVGPVQTKDEAANEKVVPKPTFELVTEISASGEEGSRMVQSFEIKDQANPQGPFGVYLKGFPQGTQLIWNSGSQFEIYFLPNATFVKGQAARQIRGAVHVVNPDGRFLEQEIDWEIKNKAAQPQLIGPTAISAAGGASIQFSVLGEDLNGESFPHVRIISPVAPGLSVIENMLNESAQNIFLTTEFVVSWVAIPMELVGQNTPIKIEVCESIYRKCRIQEIQMSVVAPL